MKHIQFKGNLKNDIEISRKKFSWLKTILTNVVAATIAVAVIISLALLINIPISLPYWIGLGVVNGALVGWNTKKNKKRFDKRKSDAISNLNNLIFSLQKENVPVNIHNLQKSQIEETKSYAIAKVDFVTGETQGIDSIDRNFYFLDNKDTLQVLNEERTTKTNDNKTDYHSSVMLFENEDLPSFVKEQSKNKSRKYIYHM